MGRLLIIGCGGVAGVAIHKCCQNSKTFTEICIASRTKSKCDALKRNWKNNGHCHHNSTGGCGQYGGTDRPDQKYQPDAVLNVALPYQDLTIMDACLACKVDYIDTANYEPEDTDDKEWRAIYENAVKKRLQHILTIPGSGHTVKNSKRQELRHCLEAGLIRE